MRYKNWLRITFAIDPSSLEDGLDRLKSFCLRHSKPAKWYDKLIGSLQHKRKKLLWTSSDLWYGTIFTRRWYLWCARSLVSIGLGFYQVIMERRCNMSSPSVAVGVTQILGIWSVQRINKGLYENCHLIIAFISLSHSRNLNLCFYSLNSRALSILMRFFMKKCELKQTLFLAQYAFFR